MPERYPEFWESDETRLWANVSHGHTSDYEAMKNDSQAIELFSAGWIEDGYSKEQRQAIRDEFFDYAIEEGYFYDRDDFDWEVWREYMGYGRD